MPTTLLPSPPTVLQVQTLVANRTLRYSSLIPIDRLRTTPVTIAGTGSIGRCLAVALATMGAERLSLYDPDVVSEENLGPQGWSFCDVGTPKVYALADRLSTINPSVNSRYYDRRLEPGDVLDPSCEVLFICVDNMASRLSVAEWIGPTWGGEVAPHFLCDTRMAAESFRILSIYDQPTWSHYRSTALFSDEDALPEPCTARSTHYCALIAAGYAISQYTQYLRGRRPVPDFVCSLPSLDIQWLTTPPPQKETSNG
jgi:sulfur carrier protein ThiS adenylyltransferase